MFGLSRVLVALSVLAAQGGTFAYASEKEERVTAREEEGRGLRGLIDKHDSNQDRNEIFKDEAHLKPPKQHKLGGDDIHPIELSLLNGASTRVVGGKDTTISQYPYYARIDLYGQFHCGGTLISREFILTAAHCNDPGTMTVTLGTDTVEGTGIKFAVAEKIPHPKYRVGNPDIYDVLLLRIQGTAPDDYVKNIPRLDDGKSNENKDAFDVIGLGSQHENTFLNAKKLQVATVNRVDQTECKNTFFDKTRLVVSADMLCAHAIGKDACQGDSGGPLVIIPNTSSHPSDHILVGITSWGIGCAHDFLPGVYARVSHVLEWIKGTICRQGLLSSYVTNTGTTHLCINLQGGALSRSGTLLLRQSYAQEEREENEEPVKEDRQDCRLLLFAQSMKAQDRNVQ
eukprot:scaffold100691_cov61-Attheya_sp.AAC.3